MGKLVNNPRRALLRIKVSPKNYRAILALLRSVITALTTNVIQYPTPAPTVIELTALAATLQTALNGLGTKKNKGSHAAVLFAQDAALAAKNGLSLELAYVGTTIALNAPPSEVAATYALAGFGFRKVKGLLKGGAPQMPRFVRQTNNRQTPSILGQIKWRKSAGTIKGAKLAGYAIHSGSPATPQNFVQNTTKTVAAFPQALGASTTYTIIPFSSRGLGVPFTITIK